tara:strand:+ start:13780 stop:14244 length:465 start_codon:yes stop_codon:yes gene_type:complete
MSQGTFSALEYLENLIEGITPKSDAHHGFVATNRGDGHTASLNDRPNSNRYFELELEGLAQDDGQAGLSGRKRIRVNCRVRYDIPHDQGYVKRLINEDVSSLINTLKGPNYDTINTGIVSLIPLTPLLEPVLDAQGDTLAFMLSLAFDLLYLEV